MCRALNVSMSGFYAWRRRPPSERDEHDVHVRRHLVAFHKASSGFYGSRRLQRDLRDAGEPCSRARVIRLMRTEEIRGKRRRRFRVTTQSAHNKSVADNLLDRHFAPAQIEEPNRAWARRHNVYLDERGMVVPRCGAGCVLAARYRLVHEP